MSRVYDSLLKSGRFSAAQIKAEKNEEIDSIGELVVLCEKQGFIPKYYTDGPQDKVDWVIKDMQKYTCDLVKGESNLETMFANAQKQIEEEQERIKIAAEMGEDLEETEEAKLFNYHEQQEITEEDYVEMADFLDEEKKKDMELI